MNRDAIILSQKNDSTLIITVGPVPLSLQNTTREEHLDQEI